MVSSLTLNIDAPSGKFLKVIHRINDSLFLLGNKKISSPINLSPELEGNIIEDQPQISEPNTAINPDNEVQDVITDHGIKEESKEINNDPNLISMNSVKLLDDINHEDDEEEDKDQEILISKEEMDQNIDEVFLTTLKLLVKNDDLPLDPGKFLKDFMKPVAKQLNLCFDFKNSSHKKINNYLKTVAKDKTKNLISFGKPKGLQNEFILSVQWNGTRSVFN